MPRLLFNHNSTRRLVQLGRNREPVVIIDNLLSSPAALIDLAATLTFAPPDLRGGYPGHRAAAPRAISDGLLACIDPIIRQTFPVGIAVPTRAVCNFSIVSLDPAALEPSQRLPHIDTPNTLRFAALLYLCAASLGGTAFYRQLATGLETVGPFDHGAYIAARQQELAVLAGTPAYPDEETPGYFQTAAFAARPNRLLLYRSCTLHSGIIPAGSSLSTDPRNGRLTLNLFVDYGQPRR
jgi:hypothetical protein